MEAILASDVLGFVTSIRGSSLSVSISGRGELPRPRVTIGNFVLIRSGEHRVIGVVSTLGTEGWPVSREEMSVHGGVELLGEIVPGAGAAQAFRRGVVRYPALGDTVEALPAELLGVVYPVASEHSATIGSLYQDPSIPACIKVNDFLSKHFAVLGSTGVGKSSAVAVIVDALMGSRSDLRVFMLDVHNEYASCFGKAVNVIGPQSLKLPFWLFSLEELSDAIYGGRPSCDEEIEILAEVIPLAKAKYGQYKEAGERQIARRSLSAGASYTVDTPVPYVLQDLISLIDERMGRLDNRSSRMHYHRLITRIETVRNDPRYGFMFDSANVGGDVMGELLAHIFRLEPDDRPITIMQLAGLPAEVMDAVVCVLCRLAFDFGVWSNGAIPLLFVCEEAHRYASADASTGFKPTRRALARIAREGRKHGVYLGLVSQRPAELDPTIISQCSTIFAMRMSNERDQAILAAAISDAVNLQAFVPLLGTGEAIAFGEGVSLPARMTFRELSSECLPRSFVPGVQRGNGEIQSNAALIGAAVERWRGATMNKVTISPDLGNGRPGRDEAADANIRAAVDQAHGRLTRRTIETPAALQPGKPEFSSTNPLWLKR